MKLRVTSALLAICFGLAAAPAHSQVSVTYGGSLAHDCFMAAFALSLEPGFTLANERLKDLTVTSVSLPAAKP